MNYDGLPVYKASYDLLLEIFGFTRNFHKEYTYTLGESIKREAVEMIGCIYRANAAQHKVDILAKAREHVEVLRLYVRLMKDLRQISLPQFVRLNEHIELVSRQLTGWQKSQKQARH